MSSYSEAAYFAKIAVLAVAMVNSLATDLVLRVDRYRAGAPGAAPHMVIVVDASGSMRKNDVQVSQGVVCRVGPALA